MADITLFELHFHDGIDVGPSSIGGGTDSDAAEALDAGEADDEDESSGSGVGKAVGILVAVALLVGLAVGAKKLLSDDLEPIEELEDLDEEA
ncbi:hypothetical protein [Halobaculum magnesiiphilum]|uniref:Uncharacterized protein n=1 Tax=Halobaculum magnesiiphilum TaxID=1017351 RepID=A0A8T8WD72_9EURY|nr:hypothetical protein [Halobaculum magnesiiphilum]QZP37822.1 hypothetical protein K6T50_01175 [Halobaculum magnesiiphilum]